MDQSKINGLTNLRNQIHADFVDTLKNEGFLFNATNEVDAEYANRVLENIIDQHTDNSHELVDTQKLRKEIMDYTLGLGLLENLIHNEQISEIMVNGKNQIFIEKNGKIYKSKLTFRSDEEILHIIQKILGPLGKRIDDGSPIVDARLKDGSRINAIIPPLSLIGPVLTIRKFRPIPFEPEDLIKNKTVSKELVNFLKIVVENRCNILISGGTSSGKTTLLNLLAKFIPSNERIITIEDSAELRLPQEHVISLECRSANVEHKGEVTIRNLVKNALRMRPDRIIVGECRSGEAIDMLQAMNTGHDGSLTTGHANNTREMLLRLETMVLMSGLDIPLRAIREQIAAAIDLIIHLERSSGGQRRVARVTEICGIEGDTISMQDIFRIEGNQITSTGIYPNFFQRLKNRGIQIRSGIFSGSFK